MKGMEFGSNGKCLLKDQPEGEWPTACADVFRFCYQLGENQYCGIVAKIASEIIAGMYTNPLGD